ncbi:phosphopantothenoylcysteine decarboxylase subunit SIS2-like [Pogonomyrmex barbatus]|uniref:Phosphopantothenoylcysteine decarboxylase subunit SIS2-like n=1 Tax=Pogonomyrmex barbatus TaxID=144034 RepID=A0A6I9XPR6_9HYME|nr:phosphopantothenoylcysteine decarboxylase subunit SIS2-like [Pogonomyrmex barbatus]
MKTVWLSAVNFSVEEVLLFLETAEEDDEKAEEALELDTDKADEEEEADDDDDVEDEDKDDDDEADGDVVRLRFPGRIGRLGRRIVGFQSLGYVVTSWDTMFWSSFLP